MTEETKKDVAVVTVVPPGAAPPREPSVGKIDLSDLPVPERARLQRLRAEVLIQRGLREHAKWLEQNGGLSKRQSAADAAIAMEVGSNLGFPLGVARTAIVVINGTPSVYGDSALALIRQSGLVNPKKGGHLRIWYTGTKHPDGSVDDDYTAHAEAQRADTGEELEVEFAVRDAKRAGLWGGDVWRAWGPLRMLRYRAIGFLARDLFSDIIRGVHIREELLGGPDGSAGTPPETPPLAPEPSAGADPLWSAPGAPPAPEDPGKTPPSPAPGPAEPPPPSDPSGVARTSPAAQEGPSRPSGPDAGTPPGAPSPAPEPPVLTSPEPPRKSGRAVLERDAAGRPLVVSRPPIRTPGQASAAVDRVRAALAASRSKAK